MRNRIFLALGIASLLTLPAAQAAVVREWDWSKNRWVTYDTKSDKFYQGTQKSAVPKEYVKYTGPYGPKTIVINTAERRLYFVYAPGKAIKYGIGVGREGFTWSGTDVVSMKAEWPGWTPPPEMIKREKANGRILPPYMPGGLNNPLGARALYIGARIYRIHGSNEPWTIGHAVSSGCIRMTNDDVVDLYNRAPVGTRVVVLMNSATSSVADKDAIKNPPPLLTDPAGVAMVKKAPAVKPAAPAAAPAVAPVITVSVPSSAGSLVKELTPAAPKAEEPAAADKAASPAKPADAGTATASIEPAAAAPAKPVIVAKVAGNGDVAGGNAGSVTAAVVIPAAPAAPDAAAVGDRMVGGAR